MKACINGAWLAYDDIGYGPAVVLLHSFPLCRQMWQSQIDALSEQGFRVIAPDLRGFGESGSCVTHFDLATLTDDVCGLMGYLGIGRAVMVGISTSCGLLLDMLERYPQRVAASCFLSPAMRPGDATEQGRRFDLAELVRHGQRNAVIDDLCEHLLNGSLSPARQRLSDQLRSWMLATSTPALIGALEEQPIRLSYRDMGKVCPVPSLILTGGRDRVMPGLKSAVSPEGARQVVDDAGHLVNLEAPGEVNRLLLDFLKKLHSIKLQHHRLQRVA